MMLSGLHGDGEDGVISVGADPRSVQADLQGVVAVLAELTFILNEVDKGFAGVGERRGKRGGCFLGSEGDFFGAACGGDRSLASAGADRSRINSVVFIEVSKYAIPSKQSNMLHPREWRLPISPPTSCS